MKKLVSLDLSKAENNGMISIDENDCGYHVKIGVAISYSGHQYIEYSPKVRYISLNPKDEIFKCLFIFYVSITEILQICNWGSEGAIITLTYENKSYERIEYEFETLEKRGVDVKNGKICPLVKRLSYKINFIR